MNIRRWFPYFSQEYPREYFIRLYKMWRFRKTLTINETHPAYYAMICETCGEIHSTEDCREYMEGR